MTMVILVWDRAWRVLQVSAFFCRLSFQMPERLFLGGNHFRFWQQTTTGAYFLATSHEEWLGEQHTIEPNGYDIG